MQLVIDEVENAGLSEIIKECEGEERIELNEETLQKALSDHDINLFYLKL